MRTLFEEELVDLSNDITRLGNAVVESFHKAIKSFKDADEELGRELISDDLRINYLTNEIEQKAYKIIALQQPVSHDLRRVFAALISSNDFERIADHSVSIARAVIRTEGIENRVDILDEIIFTMQNFVGEMLVEVIEARANYDVEAANRIAAKDKEVDAQLKRLYHEAAKWMQENKEDVARGIQYVGIGTSLERIGDYVTNICERIIYVETGSIIELNN